MQWHPWCEEAAKESTIRIENRNNRQVVTSSLVGRALLRAKRINGRSNGRHYAEIQPEKEAKINGEARDALPDARLVTEWQLGALLVVAWPSPRDVR